MKLFPNIMARSKRKKVKTDRNLKNKVNKQNRKEVRPPSSQQATDHQTICWHLGKFDWEGPWGEAACEDLDFRQLLDATISNWESMTWAEIFTASGGRAKGNNSHPIDIADLSTAAKRRLKEIPWGDIESVVSLRLSAKVRFYGIREGRVFQFLWYDPWHDNKAKAVCPSSK